MFPCSYFFYRAHRNYNNKFQNQKIWQIIRSELGDNLALSRSFNDNSNFSHFFLTFEKSFSMKNDIKTYNLINVLKKEYSILEKSWKKHLNYERGKKNFSIWFSKFWILLKEKIKSPSFHSNLLLKILSGDPRNYHIQYYKMNENYTTMTKVTMKILENELALVSGNNFSSLSILFQDFYFYSLLSGNSFFFSLKLLQIGRIPEIARFFVEGFQIKKLNTLVLQLLISTL